MYGRKLLWAEIDNNRHGPILLWAEMTQNHVHVYSFGDPILPIHYNSRFTLTSQTTGRDYSGSEYHERKYPIS